MKQPLSPTKGCYDDDDDEGDGVGAAVKALAVDDQCAQSSIPELVLTWIEVC